MAGEGGKGGALRELVAFLGFDLDEKKLDRADKRVDALKERSELLTRGLEAVGIALGLREIGEFISSQIEMGAAIEHTSQQLGIGVEDLQAFQYAAATTGLNIDEANNALKFLSKNLGEANLNNAEAVKTFAELHVATKNADGSARGMADVIADVANGFQNIKDPAIRTATAMKVFGRQGASLIPLLKKGGDGVEALYREFEQLGGGLSEDFIQTAEEAEHQMVKFKTATRGLSSEIGASLLPFVSDLASGAAVALATFREWTKHTHFLRNALITLAAIAGILVITWGILNIEILLVVAALALLALAVDDVITFFEGGDSLLGRFLDKLYGLGASKEIAKQLRDAWKEVSDAFGKLWDAVKQLGPDLKNLFDTFTTNKGDVTNAKTGIQNMADAVAGLADHLKSAVEWFDKMVKKFDDFSKAHPLLVHAYQRSAHQVGQGNFGVGGALKALGGDVVEAATGDTSIETGEEKVGRLSRELSVPRSNAEGEYSSPTPYGPVQQHNETHITLYGVNGGQDAALKVNGAVRDGQTDANNAAFSAVGGGGAP